MSAKDRFKFKCLARVFTLICEL